jgi:hypothetical protein
MAVEGADNAKEVEHELRRNKEVRDERHRG